MASRLIVGLRTTDSKFMTIIDDVIGVGMRHVVVKYKLGTNTNV